MLSDQGFIQMMAIWILRYNRTTPRAIRQRPPPCFHQTTLRTTAMSTTTPKTKNPRNKSGQDEVLSALFAQVSKPDGIVRVNCVNVFDSRWRINLWASLNNPVVPNAGRIMKSYFVKFENGWLEILED